MWAPSVQCQELALSLSFFVFTLDRHSPYSSLPAASHRASPAEFPAPWKSSPALPHYDVQEYQGHRCDNTNVLESIHCIAHWVEIRACKQSDAFLKEEWKNIEKEREREVGREEGGERRWEGEREEEMKEGNGEITCILTIQKEPLWIYSHRAGYVVTHTDLKHQQ